MFNAHASLHLDWIICHLEATRGWRRRYWRLRKRLAERRYVR